MMKLYSDDAIAGMHEAALTALEDLGMKILLPEARQIYRAGGARVAEAEAMVWIGRDMVAAALAVADDALPPVVVHDSSDNRAKAEAQNPSVQASLES